MAEAGAAAVGQVPRQHGPAGAEDGRDVEPGRGHEQAGHILVAVGNQHQSVELVGQHHGLGGIGDQVPRDQGILHADVAHGDAVAHGDGREFDGRAAGGADSGFHRLHDLVDIHMAGHDLVEGADHAHQGALQLFPGKAQGVEQTAVGRAARTQLDLVG